MLKDPPEVLSTQKGMLFDVANVGSEIILWVKHNGKTTVLYDKLYPRIYIRGNINIVKKFIQRLVQLDGILKVPKKVFRKDFYSGKEVMVLEVIISKPELLQKIRRKLYFFYGKMEIYHADIEPTILYMQQKNIYPLAHVQVVYKTQNNQNKVYSISSLCDQNDFEYRIAPLRIMELFTKTGFRNGFYEGNPLLVRTYAREINLLKEKFLGKNMGSCIELKPDPKGIFLHQLNKILEEHDPDIIFSEHGDQFIFPELFSLAQKMKIPMLFDRGLPTIYFRKIQKKGHSYLSYGNHIFRASPYPLMGRWHIDTENSFIFRESKMIGVLELARLSRTPVQKLSRISTGAALTSIETETAIRHGYLVPWQKSQLENTKTAYQLLQVDKGGLTYQPDIRNGKIFEKVAQIDFSQMYPTIMSLHNISPETVNCVCCNHETGIKVPQTHYYTCTRRRGVVSESLEKILERRQYYKDRISTSFDHEKYVYNAKQSALKWLLVTSFGYLGYRNAKFGKLESHEAVSAYGREKLLLAKEVAEEWGFTMLHAMTDSLFLYQRGTCQLEFEKKLEQVVNKVQKETSLRVNIDGIYSWLVFLPSQSKSNAPVATRYFGKFQDGSVKFRGIAARRKDTPVFFRKVQRGAIRIMAKGHSIGEVIALRAELLNFFFESLEKLRGFVDLDRVYLKNKNMRMQIAKLLCIRKTISREFENYKVNNASRKVLALLKKSINASIAPGEKVRYIVVKIAESKKREYFPEEQFLRQGLLPNMRLHAPYYLEFLQKVFREIFEPFCPDEFFEEQLSLISLE